MSARTILLTGFPGFIGSRLIPQLLRDDPDARVAALVEPRMADRAREAAARIGAGERLDVVPGDITDPLLGLDPQEHRRLAGETVAIHHLAAIYDLAVPQAVAERVNVLGTQHVVAFARACTRLERHNYVSTAYVAGQRRGRVLEADLWAGQGFKNHYESTKFAAEVVVRASMDDVPTTIYRPAIVVGDSRTGETQKFDGPYYLLRTIHAMVSRPGPLLAPGAMQVPFNVVPVDFVVDAMAAGAREAGAAGETLHLVDPDPMIARDVFDLLSREYAQTTPRGRLPWALADVALRLRAGRRYYGGTPRESLVYLNHPLQYDTSRAEEVLGRQGLRCPGFSEYVGPMVRFFAEHEDDPAFAPGG